MEGYQRIELAVRRSGFGNVGDTGMEAVRRSRHAIEIGLKSNWGRLFRHTLTLTGDVDNARDLIQQRALYALASSSAPSDPTPARAWLFKIVAMPGSTNIADKR